MTDTEIRLAHTIDDAERQRTRSLRAVTAQAELLELGLCALRMGSPAVTDEYLERAIAALRYEALQLRRAHEPTGGHVCQCSTYPADCGVHNPAAR